MTSSDTFISTVATTLPVFMLATMLELARLERGRRSSRGWIRKIDAVGYWAARVLGWAMIATFAIYEVALVQELARPETERTDAAGVVVVFGTSVFLLLAVIAMGALSRSETSRDRDTDADRGPRAV